MLGPLAGLAVRQSSKHLQLEIKMQPGGPSYLADDEPVELTVSVVDCMYAS